MSKQRTIIISFKPRTIIIPAVLVLQLPFLGL
jgi:hypothetical protein